MKQVYTKVKSYINYLIEMNASVTSNDLESQIFHNANVEMSVSRKISNNSNYNFSPMKHELEKNDGISPLIGLKKKRFFFDDDY